MLADFVLQIHQSSDWLETHPFCVNPTHSLTAVNTLFWVTRISHYLLWLNSAKIKHASNSKHRPYVWGTDFWIFWVYFVSKIRLLWNQILAPFTSNITAVNHCDPFCQNATGQTQLHYMWLITLTIPNSTWIRLGNSYYHEIQLFNWSKLLPPRPIFRGCCRGLTPHRKFLGLPFCGKCFCAA